jgi:hypothetical protein
MNPGLLPHVPVKDFWALTMHDTQTWRPGEIELVK